MYNECDSLTLGIKITLNGKRTSNYNMIAYWSQQTYALFYTQARTATTVLDMPNALHNQTRSP